MNTFPKNLNVSMLVVITVLASFAGLVSTMRGSPLLGIFFSLILVVGCLFVFTNFRDKALTKIFLIAITMRTGLAFFHRFIASLPDSTADAQGFERLAWQMSNGDVSRPGIMGIIIQGSETYSSVMAYIYRFFGRSPLILQVLNVILGSLVVVLAYKTIMVLFNKRRAALLASLLVAFFPTFNLYSAITLRETFVVFFLALSFYFFSFWLQMGGTRYILLSLLFSITSGVFHGAMIIIVFSYIPVYIFYRPKERRWVLFSKKLLVGGILLLVMVYLFFGQFPSKIPSPAEITPERLEEEVHDRATGRAAYLRNLVPDSYFDVAWQTPVRAFYFYFSPFPWDAETKSDLVGMFDAFLYMVLFVLFILSLRILFRENRALFFSVILIFAVFSVTFAWGTSNYGTAIRHRQKIVFLLIVISSYSLSLIKFKGLHRVTGK